MSRIINCEQGTDEWFACRLGKLSASVAHIIATNGKGLETLCLEKATEILTGKVEESYKSDAMQHGNDYEAEARNIYELETGNKVTQIGFWEFDDFVGVSPDGLVNEDGLVEIKCLSNDSEILTNKGFMPIKDITVFDKVAEYTKDGKIKFVNPQAVIHKKYNGKIYNFYRYNKKTMSLTEDHRIIYLDENNKIKETNPQCFNTGYGKHIPVGGFVDGSSSLKTIDKFLIACNADGHIPTNNRIVFDFSKQRKINKIIEYLDELRFDYEVKKERDFKNPKWKNSTRIYIKANGCNFYKQGLSATFNLENFNTQSALDFIKEISFWDGTISQSNNVEYTSKNKSDVDFVAAICVIANKKTNICRCNDAYMITISGFGEQSKNTRQCINFLTRNSGQKIENEDYNDFVHCVTVDSGMFIARIGGSCPFVTGNCPTSKTYTQYLLDGKIKPEYYSQMQMQMYITGRQWCDYVVYNSDFEKPIIIKRVYPDEEERQRIAKGLEDGVIKIKEIVKKAKEQMK